MKMVSLAVTPPPPLMSSANIAKEIGAHQGVISWAAMAESQAQNQALKDLIKGSGTGAAVVQRGKPTQLLGLLTRRESPTPIRRSSTRSACASLAACPDDWG